MYLLFAHAFSCTVSTHTFCVPLCLHMHFLVLNLHERFVNKCLHMRACTILHLLFHVPKRYFEINAKPKLFFSKLNKIVCYITTPLNFVSKRIGKLFCLAKTGLFSLFSSFNTVGSK